MLTYSQFTAALPQGKRTSDTVWAKVALRPLSMPIAWLLYRAGVSGNAVSAASVFITIAASILLACTSATAAVIAVILFNVVALGDCVDGNIARASGKTGPGGEWMDALGGYAVCALLPIALGWRLDSQPDSVGTQNWALLMGALASAANLFARLIHHKHVSVFGGHTGAVNQRSSVVGFISAELSLGGWMMPALAAAVLTGFGFSYLVLYFVFYCAGATFVALTMAGKILRS